MNAAISLLMVLLLVAVAWIGAAAGGELLFGVVVPYIAVLVFLAGFVWKIVRWTRAPVPFRIPTTAGQQQTLPWLPHDKLDNPATGLQVLGRMALEVLLFRSLWRNTKAQMAPGARLVYGSNRWLWLFALAFHWTFLVILVRHLRFFVEPVPGLVHLIDRLDSFFQVTVPALYVTDAVILLSLGYLLLRRLTNGQVRAISLAPDYFPLWLLLGVAVSGVLMRYFTKTDVVGMKELGTGLIALRFTVPEGIGVQAYVHLFLVCSLVAYFPLSKLMHAGGVFLSPTRNMANTNRMKRHVNPWNRPVGPHKFEDWEKEFAEEIAEAGYKLERD